MTRKMVFQNVKRCYKETASNLFSMLSVEYGEMNLKVQHH